MNLLFLTLPAVVFVALVCLLVAALSAVSALLLLRMVDSPGRWKDHTQIAWVGIAPVSGNSLTLGSPVAGAVPGWPGNHIAPTINFTVGPGGQITLRSYGGGGFVLDNKDNVLYGTSLDQDQN